MFRSRWFRIASMTVRRFLWRPADPFPFACMRIGIALCLLAKAWAESDSIVLLFGNHGMVQWSISDPALGSWLPRSKWVADFLQPAGIDADNSVRLVFILHVTSLFGLMVGWQSRIMALQAWLTFLLLSNGGVLTTYGLDSFAKIALFYCVLMPVGSSMSVDRLTGRLSGKPTSSARLFLRVLQLHLCLIYLSAGLGKLQGIQWWNGEAIWRALNTPQFRTFELTWLAEVPWLVKLACWGTLLLETGYCVGIWPARLRPWWLLAIVSMHLAIASLMRLWLFSAALIILNISAFGSEWANWGINKSREWLGIRFWVEDEKRTV